MGRHEACARQVSVKALESFYVALYLFTTARGKLLALSISSA